MNDSELIEAFERGTLHPFPHELHVRVARVLSREPDGYGRMAAGIKRMAPEKYHETMTRAWWELILAAEDALLDRSLLSRYYSPAALESGRERWVEPDLRPLRSAVGEDLHERV
jgi:hypothetical protein